MAVIKSERIIPKEKQVPLRDADCLNPINIQAKYPLGQTILFLHLIKK